MLSKNNIRAFFTEDFIRIYQAYNSTIAESAVTYQQFVSPPFKYERTTWIKPSFLWMMYRSGWATKENQERVLAIDITHSGFKWALKNSCLSHFEGSVYKSYEEWQKAKACANVIVQWDPERDIFLNKLDCRAIQIGLNPIAAKLYATEWVLKITDITDEVIKIKSLIDGNNIAEAKALLPLEITYTV